MGKKQAKQIPFKIVAATSMTIFSLLAAFMGTIAWFNSTLAAKTGSDGFNVYSGSSIDILSCYAVRYDGSYGAIAFDIFANEHPAIMMSEYDYIFTDRNVNTPLFLRMEIAGFNASNDLVITIPCTGTYKTNNKVDPFLSNVVCAKFMSGLKVDDGIPPEVDEDDDIIPDTYCWTGTSVHNADVLASYQGMLAHAAEDSGTPYVSSESKQNSITLTLDVSDAFDEDYIVSRTNARGETVDAVVIFLALDYYVATINNTTINLVSQYIASYGGTHHSFIFSSDISSVTLSNEGGES